MGEGEGICMAYSDVQVGRVQLHLFGRAISVAVAVLGLQRVDALVAAALARFLFILATQVSEPGEHLRDAARRRVRRW